MGLRPSSLRVGQFLPFGPHALENLVRNLARAFEPITRSAAFLTALGLTLAASSVAEQRRPAANPLYDVVAVGRAPGKIILATPALPLEASRWRFRSIPVRPAGAMPEAVMLSRSGTKLLVVLPGGATRVLDLTEKLSAFDEAPQTPNHRLPGQWFPVANGGEICLVDDTAHALAGGCRAAARAVVHQDGRVLYATERGNLFVPDTVSGADPPLPYLLPPGARVELLAGLSGDAHDFLILVEHNGQVQVVDPSRPQGVLGTHPNWEVAALHALLDFASSRQPRAEGEPVSEQALQTFAANLVQQSEPETYQWSFFRVKPELALYAPVLEFAPNEPAYPSDLGIWNTLNAISKGTTREAYQEAYDSLGAERWRRCKVYFRATSYPGSWLLEYWYYYPFDEGKPHRHIHDSEHVFIEVDKLGGTVRSFLASDHGQFAPNNSYSTFVRGAAPVELPLYALVEFEKHAMSPDINRDGAFTRGVDENLYREAYAVWGLRDVGGNRSDLLEPYRASMSLPRKKEDRFALTNSAGYYPDLDVNPDNQTCGLLPFPDDPPCNDCSKGTVGNAEAHLTSHTDARRPEDIYKPWVLPWRQVRLGIALFDHAGAHRELYAAYVSDIVHLTGGLIPLGGRISFEVSWTPRAQEISFTSNGQTVLADFSSQAYLGARYERLVTNSQGFYFGATPLFRHFANETVNGVPATLAPHWQYDSLWLRAGSIFEMPFQKKGNMTHYVGVAFQGLQGIRFEWRVSLGLLRRRGRTNFGIRPDDANPYE